MKWYECPACKELMATKGGQYGDGMRVGFRRVHYECTDCGHKWNATVEPKFEDDLEGATR